MDTVYRVMAAVWRVLRSRAFSASVLAVICTVIVAFVSLNMTAVTIVDGDASRVVLTLHDDPYRALAGAGIQLEEGDEVVADVQSASIEINRAFDIQVTADEKSTLFRMGEGTTVADAIEKSGVYIGQHDKMNLALETPLSDGMQIVVNRVAYREFTKTQSIPFETETIYTSTLPKGKTQTSQNGVKGVKTLTYRECMENGKVVGTELVSEAVTVKPVNAKKLMGVTSGTPMSKAPFDIPLDGAGQPLHYTKKFNGRATAYTSDRGDAGAWTSWAGKARVGVVAVDPRKIPYGSKLYITSPDGSYVYGYAIAGDTGGALRSGRAIVDVYLDTYEETRSFGVRNMNVYIIG